MKIGNRDIIMWLCLAALLIGTGIMLNWHFNKAIDTSMFDKLLSDMQTSRAIDSVNILQMTGLIKELEVQNNELKEAVMNNRAMIKKLQTLSINKQYEVYLYTSSATRDYFMQNTGGGIAEIIEKNPGDTCMITPIENIKTANIKLVQLEYVIQERDQYVDMSEKLDQEIQNLEGIIGYKDSVISIKDNQITQCDTVIQSFKNDQEKKIKELKKQKTKTWIVAGIGAAGIVLISILQ